MEGESGRLYGKEIIEESRKKKKVGTRRQEYEDKALEYYSIDSLSGTTILLRTINGRQG